MVLRQLKIKDAPYMLEWMHDDFVVHNLKTNFLNYTITDCQSFIILSQNNINNLHLAIVNNQDEYLGTVSLKNIVNYTAEFAITIRKCAMGRGISQWAMKEIINLGFSKGIKYIYWYVSPQNLRAIKFYEKNGYQTFNLNDIPQISVKMTQKQIKTFVWYLCKND